MTGKPVKTLAVFDLDNTLTDTLTFWATAITPVAHVLSTHFGMDEKHMVDTILSAPGQYRFSDIGRLITWLDARGELPRAHNPAEQHDIDVTKWVLTQNWYATQKKMSHFYPGALDTLRALKDGGTDVALYTDTEASSMIRRLWLMAHNARRAGHVKDELEVIRLFDHFYSHPSIDDDQGILRDVDVQFTLRMKQKMSMWKTGVYKPAPAYLETVVNDFGTTPAATVMVGDTHNDGGGAVPLRAHFAWAHYGARIAPEIEAAARRMASSHYKYGVRDIVASFDNSNRPDVTLQDSVHELFDHFAFGAGNGFNPQNGKATGWLPRTSGGQAAQNPHVHRVYETSPSPQRRSPLGPATHLTPAP